MATNLRRVCSSDYDYLFKLMLIGDCGVGKSSMIFRYHYNEFESNYISTIGIDFEFRTIAINEKICKLQIWDTAGQDKFRSITTSYYRNAHGIILVYDVTDEDSFLNISHWICQCEKYSSFKQCQFLLVGNKCDCNKDERVVSKARGLFVAKENNMRFYECSAKEDININKIFYSITKQIIYWTEIQKMNLKKLSMSTSKQKSIDINQNDESGNGNDNDDKFTDDVNKSKNRNTGNKFDKVCCYK